MSKSAQNVADDQHGAIANRIGGIEICQGKIGGNRGLQDSLPDENGRLPEFLGIEGNPRQKSERNEENAENII